MEPDSQSDKEVLQKVDNLQEEAGDILALMKENGQVLELPVFQQVLKRFYVG